eukprot:2288252-Amphidinium_carterae.2
MSRYGMPAAQCLNINPWSADVNRRQAPHRKRTHIAKNHSHACHVHDAHEEDATSSASPVLPMTGMRHEER